MTTVVLDDKQWKKFFGRLRRDLKDPLPKLKTLAATQGFANIIAHFRDERGYEGKWQQRKWTTQAAYAKLNKKNKRYNPNNKLLVLTGDLRKDFRIAKRQKRGHIISNHGVELYTEIPYAGTHNYGHGDIPKREFMYLDGDTQQKLADSLIKWLNR